MNKQQFTHLHLHTDASFIDGLGTVDRTVEHAKSLGFESLAMTDHGNLTNTISFTESCITNGLKPIIGMEGYVRVDGKRFHITMLADGNDGFRTLVELNNIGQSNIELDSNRPTFEIGDFKNHNMGLYILSGCPESPMQSTEWSDARDVAVYLKNIFDDRFLIEMMFVNYGTPYHRALKLSQDLKVPLVVTNDVHFAKRTDRDLHTRLLKMKAGGFSYNSEHLFLTTEQDLIERVTSMDKSFLPHLQKGMSNAYKLSQKLNSVTFNSTPHLPHIENANELLRQKCNINFAKKLSVGLIPPIQVDEYVDRMDRELKVIIDADFSSYFLILDDIVSYAHTNNVWVGKGRGSGAGSLVLYILGITDIDPIKFDLEFARFLNYKRADMPDVDMDFESEKRDEIIKYAASKWNGIPIATYSTYKHKSAMIDLGKSYRIEKDVREKASEYGEDSEYFEYISKNYEDFGEMYQAIKNQYRHIGQHAGGVVITNDETPTPLIRTAKNDLVLAWTEGTYRELSKVGMVKFDLLGLSSGSILRRLKEVTGVLPEEPVDNHEVFNIFSTGNTLGVFQFGSEGIVSFLKEVKPNKFEDLVAINALYRPGPLDSGAAFNYPKLKNSGDFRSLHKDIDHFLKDTYGIIVFQEQYMKIIAWLTDGELEDADLARKVLTKAAPENPSWVKRFNELKQQFYDGAKLKGWSEIETNKVWGEIQTHSGYSFNRSHSVSYAMIAWELAWYKYYYPTQFYAQYLTVESSDPDKVNAATLEAVMSGIQILPPNINESTNEYVGVDNKIYLPITSVKFVGENSLNKLQEYRPFVSVQDYVNRVPKSVIKKRGREGLLALGAFDDIMNDTKEPHKLLDTDDVSKMNTQQKQKQYLGYVLPNKKFIDAYEKAKDLGYIVGYVDNVEVREGKRGKYYKVNLMPQEWFCDFEKFKPNKYKEGDVIAIQYHGIYHKLTDLKGVII